MGLFPKRSAEKDRSSDDQQAVEAARATSPAQPPASQDSSDSQQLSPSSGEATSAEGEGLASSGVDDVQQDLAPGTGDSDSDGQGEEPEFPCRGCSSVISLAGERSFHLAT